MFDNLSKQFEGMFGKLEPGTCKITMNGNIAIRCGKGYKTYNVKKGILTNVTNFCFSMDEMFFVIPTTHVVPGDIIFVAGKPKCVISVEKGTKVIEVIDYENSEIKRITPERHVFMGSTYFYGKIVSMFGNAFKNGNGMKNILKMMMFNSMMGGNNANNANGNGGNSMMSMMGMMAMMGGMGGKDGNMFEGMFDFSLDDTDDSNILPGVAEEADENNDEEEA